MERTEQLRRRYRPEAVTVLFVGESAPAAGTFFYDNESRSRLRNFTEEVMRAELGGRIGGDFLRSFQRIGCYLDDLCVEPVNRLRGKARREACRACEPDIARRLVSAAPAHRRRHRSDPAGELQSCADLVAHPSGAGGVDVPQPA